MAGKFQGDNGRKCDTCNFFNRETSECRRSAPVRLPRKFAYGATAGSRVREEELLWGWPKVRPNDWCGDYEFVP